MYLVIRGSNPNENMISASQAHNFTKQPLNYLQSVNFAYLHVDECLWLVHTYRKQRLCALIAKNMSLLEAVYRAPDKKG